MSQGEACLQYNHLKANMTPTVFEIEAKAIIYRITKKQKFGAGACSWNKCFRVKGYCKMWRLFCIVLKELLTPKKLIVDENMSEARWAGRDQDKKQQEGFVFVGK